MAEGGRKVDTGDQNSPADTCMTNGIETIIPLSRLLNPEHEEEDRCDYYQWTMDDLHETLITSWYSIFSNHTFPTVMLPLNEDVLAYLQDEKVHLPEGVSTTAFTAIDQIKFEKPGEVDELGDRDRENEFRLEEIHLFNSSDERGFDDSLSQNEDEGLDLDDFRAQTKAVPKFTHLDTAIEGVITSFKDSVFPKLNWKCPKDAAWIGMNKSLRSFVPGDIYLLFKSSSRVLSMFEQDFFERCKDYNGKPIPEYFLVLRQWMDINPAFEFRCFVINGKFVAISQREYTASYPTICQCRDAIMSDLFHFFKEVISPNLQLSHYVFDVVRSGPRKVELVDLNIFGTETDGCLFSYRELRQLYDEMTHPKSNAANAGEVGDTSLSTEEEDTYGVPTFRFINQDKMVVANPFLSNAPVHDARICISSGISLQQLTDNYAAQKERK